LKSVLTSDRATCFRNRHTRLTALLPQFGEVWKWQRTMRPMDRLRFVGRPSSAVTEYDNAARAYEAGLPTPRPIFAAERRILGLIKECVIAFEFPPDTVPFADLEEDRRALLGECGELLARAHRAGIVHGDLVPGNILVQGNGADRRVLLIDWGISWQGIALGATRQKSDLSRLLLHLAMSGLTAAEARGLVAGYEKALDLASDARRELRSWLRGAIRTRLANKMKRKWENALRDGGRLVSRQVGKHRIVAFREIGTDRIAATAAGAVSLPPRASRGARPLEGAEVVPDPDAARPWATAYMLRRFHLPCRRALGAVVGGSGGCVIMEPEAGEPVEPGPDEVERVRRLFEFYGIAFAGPRPDFARVESFATRRSGGLLVRDPAQLRFTPA
jgi:tRNA A-37 threonylcarbamoyl transferase component Bud32